MKRKAVTSLGQLVQLALDRKSVVGFHAHRDIPIPAAVMVNMPALLVHRSLMNRLYIYTPAKSVKPRYHIPLPQNEH
jgi:hypothetical protein